MRVVERVGCGALVGMAMLATSVTAATAQPQGRQTSPAPLSSQAAPAMKDDGAGPRTEEALAAQAQPLQITVTDGLYTDRDPRVAFRVEGCTTGDVGATSEAFESATFDAPSSVLTARVVDGLDPDTYDVTFTCTGPQASQTESYRFNQGAEPDREISISFTDGQFTEDDPRIRFRVSNCKSNKVRARSPIFSSISYDRGSRMVTARIERGTKSGSYPLVVTCAGQPALRARARINSSLDRDDDDGGGENFPEGGIDTGRGGAAGAAEASAAADADRGIPPEAGWLLLLLSVPTLGWLVRSGRLKGRRNLA